MKLFLCFFITFYGLGLCAQSPVEWGKFTRDEIKMDRYEKDTSAAAVVLSDHGSIELFVNSDDGVGFVFRRHKRIKVLSKQGLGFADVTIPYYQKDKIQESVFNIRAQSFKNGKITELDSKEIYKNSINGNWSSRDFSIPNVEPGSIVEFQYTIQSPRVHSLFPWYFQESIPVMSSILKLEFLNYFNFMYFVNQEEHLQLERKESSYSGGAIGSDLKEYTLYFKMEDLPAIKEEEHVTTIENHIAKVEFQLLELNHSLYGRNKFMKDWEEMAYDLKIDQNFGHQFSKGKNFKNIKEAYTKSRTASKNDQERVQDIYEFVLNNVTWNGNYRLFSNKDLDDAFEKKTANSAELNFMFIALLREEGMEAYPALLSTRTNGKYIKSHPIMKQFNHVITCVSIDGKEHLIDVSNINYPMELLPSNSLNSEACVLKGKEIEWQEIKPLTSFWVYQYKVDFTEEEVQSNMTANFKGYPATYYKYLSGQKNPQKKVTEFIDDDYGILEMNFNQKEGNKNSIQLLMSLENESIDLNAEFLYLNPIVIKEFFDIPFKQNRRVYPIEMAFPRSYQYLASIEIPKGFEVVELPESIRMSIPTKKMIMSYVAEKKEDRINIAFRHQINALFYPKESYPQLKEFYTKMVEKLGEQIVFKKK